MKYRCIQSNIDWFKKFNELIDNNDNNDSYKSIFDHLIDGISFDAFISDIFEQTPCLFHRRENDANQSPIVEIISKKSFIQLIKTEFNDEIDPMNNISAVRYINDERDDLDWFNIKSSKKRKSQNDETIVTSKHIEMAFSDKYTIQFYQPQRFVDPLHKINSSFEYKFGSLAGSSAYLTPNNTQGLPPHNDDVDVFVLQTEGEKEWYIWNGLQELPDTYTRISRVDLPSEFKKIVLRKGDMLYLPRGTIHEAIAKDSFSSHVTISVYQHYNMKTLLSRALPLVLNKAFEQNLNIRKGLPIKLCDTFGTFAGRFGKDTIHPHITSSRQGMLKECKDIISNLADYVTMDTIDQAVDEIAMDFIDNRLPPPIITKKGKTSKGKLSANSMIRLVDPSIMQCLIQEVEGVSLLIVFNALQNNRLSHMGHPVDDDDEESEDETLSFPSRLAPVIVTLTTAFPNLIKISDMSKQLKLCQIHPDEVLETIQTLSQYNFIENY